MTIETAIRSHDYDRAIEYFKAAVIVITEQLKTNKSMDRETLRAMYREPWSRLKELSAELARVRPEFTQSKNYQFVQAHKL